MWRTIIFGLGLCALPACEGAERQKTTGEIRAVQRLQVLIAGGGWAPGVNSGGWALQTPTYFRDRATGLCFAATFGETRLGLAAVPCGVVEGARNALLAKGWEPGTEPPPLDDAKP